MTSTSIIPGTARYTDCPGGQLRHVDFRVEVCDSFSLWNRGGPKSELSGIMEMLAEVRGIESMWARGYKLSITLGAAFTWPEVWPEVERIIAVFGEAIAT